MVQTPFDERDGQFSPDGKWIAYQSNETGHYEIYVQPFPGPGGGKWQITNDGGVEVRWRHDGREIFYIALDGRLMAMPIRMDSSAPSVEPGTPVALFRPRIASGATLQGFKQQYAVSSDGQRFLVNSLTEEATTSPITLILNWKPSSSEK